VPHTFIAEQDTTMLGMVTPGGTEAFYVEGGPVADGPEPPPIDMERMQAAARAHDCELVGPPLTLDD
jgi:hypothetical protein